MVESGVDLTEGSFDGLGSADIVVVILAERDAQASKFLGQERAAIQVTGDRERQECGDSQAHESQHRVKDSRGRTRARCFRSFSSVPLPSRGDYLP